MLLERNLIMPSSASIFSSVHPPAPIMKSVAMWSATWNSCCVQQVHMWQLDHCLGNKCNGVVWKLPFLGSVEEIKLLNEVGVFLIYIKHTDTLSAECLVKLLFLDVSLMPNTHVRQKCMPHFNLKRIIVSVTSWMLMDINCWVRSWTSCHRIKEKLKLTLEKFCRQ